MHISLSNRNPSDDWLSDLKIAAGGRHLQERKPSPERQHAPTNGTFGKARTESAEIACIKSRTRTKTHFA
jgi:hypothetical protein